MNNTLFEVRNAAVLEAIKNGAREYIDTHNGREEVRKLEGYLVLESGYVCPLYKNTAFCLNDLYMQDGKVYLSTASVAGNIYPAESVDKSVDNYNREMIQYNHRIGRGEKTKTIVAFEVF